MKVTNILFRICNNSQRIYLLRKNGIKIGDHCEIYKDVSFGSEPYLIKIGNNVRITSGVKFSTHDGGLWVLRNKYKSLQDSDKFGAITIGNNVHIGINAIIMPGVTIHDNVIIGAGAIVTKDIPSNCVAAGVPAKIIESVDDYYDKNKNKLLYTKRMSRKQKKEYLLNNSSYKK